MNSDTSLTNLLSVVLIRGSVKDSSFLNQVMFGGGEPAAVHVKNAVVLIVAVLLLGCSRMSAGTVQANK